MSISFKITDLEAGREYIRKYDDINQLNSTLKKLAQTAGNYLKVWIDVYIGGRLFFGGVRFDITKDAHCFIDTMEYRSKFYKTEKGINYNEAMRRYFPDNKSAKETSDTYQFIANECKNQQVDSVARFEVGFSYLMTFVTDSNLKVKWTITKRTAKTITLTSEHNKTVTKKIKTYRASEYVEPYERYSMSPFCAPPVYAKNKISTEESKKEAKKESDLDDNAECWLWMCGQ